MIIQNDDILRTYSGATAALRSVFDPRYDMEAQRAIEADANVNA
jgi:hypothetical protein